MNLKGIFSTYSLIFLSIVLFPLDQLFSSLFPFFAFSPFRLLYILLAFFVVFVRPSDFLGLKGIIPLLFFYCVLAFISVLWAKDMDASLMYTLQLTISLFFFIVSVSELKNKPEYFGILAFCSCLVGGMVSLLALQGFFSQGIELSAENRMRFIGIGINPVAISIGCTAILGLYILLAKSEPKWRKYLIILSELCIVYFLFRTGTRSVIFGLIIAVGISAILTMNLNVKNIIKILSLVIIIALVFNYAITNFVEGGLQERVLAIKEDNIRENARGDLWEIAFDWYTGNIMGTGAGNEFVAYKNVYNKEAHNLFISSLLQLGILAFIVILVVVIKIGLLCFKIKNDLLKFVLIALFVFWVIQMMKGSFLQTRLFWIPAVLICSGYFIDRNFEFGCTLKK